jgi:phage pi2 protein 07
MKAITILMIFFLIVSSCSAPVIKDSHDTKRDSMLAWNILNDSIREGIESKELIVKLGNPHKVEAAVNNSFETWTYYHPKTNVQKWVFEIDKIGKIVSVTYLPSSDKFSNFSLESVRKSWGNLSCENKNKQEVFPDFIKETIFLSCEKGKRYVEYNKYNEVALISVEK